MKRFCSAGFIIGLSCLVAATAFATVKPTDQDTVRTYTMDAVQITASKLPQAQGNVTQKIDVIDGNVLRTQVLGRRNLAEWIEFLPGASVSVLSRNDANWGAYGGIGPKYSTVLVSGLPADAFVDAQALAPEAVERVEVQRGPASVMYPNYLSQDFSGNQSPLSGTVNWVVREKVDAAGTRLAADYGSYNTLGGRLSHERRVGPVHLRAGVSYEKSDYTDYGTNDSWLHMIDNPQYSKFKAYSNAAWFSRDGTEKLSVFGNLTLHTGDAGRPNRGYDHAYGLLNAAYIRPVGNSATLQAKIGYRHYDRSWEEDRFSNGGDLALASRDGVVQNIIPADVTLSIRHGSKGLFTAGGDFQSARYETDSNPASGGRLIGNQSSSWQAGAFAQEEIGLGNAVLRLGARFNSVRHQINLLGGSLPGKKEGSWNKALWSAGVKWNGWSWLSPFANIGTGFMVPGLKSVGGTLRPEDRGAAGRHGQLPNPDLKPEQGLGIDAGLDVKPCADTRLTVRVFQNRIEDAIVDNVVSLDPSQSQSINAGSARATGIEAEIRRSFSRRIESFLNYTMTSTEIQNEVDPDQDGAAIPFVPDHTANVGVNASLPYGISAAAVLHLAGELYDSSSKSGRRKFKGYERLNITVRKTLWDGRIAVYAQFYNVTDNRFEMPWQFRDPGFAAAAGVQINR